MGVFLAFFFFLVSLPAILSQDITSATVVVDGSMELGRNDDNFICATLDWWPQDKCDYNQCPWGNASVINLNLSQPLLAKAIQAFSPLRIRIGGSLQDQLLYDVGNSGSPCHPFRKMNGGLFGFSNGCLHMNRWDEVYQLLNRTGSLITFGLNALHGRHKMNGNEWGGAWNPDNTRDFMKYTISKGQHIDSWEYGNELSGPGIGASVNSELYGKDVIDLKNIINDLYKESPSKPALLAPGGFFDEKWYAELLRVSGSDVVNVLTHHIYNLGAGVDPNLESHILDPKHLDQISKTFSDLKETIEKNGPWSSAWVGESGGAFNSGGRHLSDTYVNSFWYLDQLGMSSKYNTKVYCRQTLIGGNYGLLNLTTFIPTPDYYSALLWHRLMGKGVLDVDNDGSSYLRTYAHCSKGRDGITLLLINLSNNTAYKVGVKDGINMKSIVKKRNIRRGTSFMRDLKISVKWVGNRQSNELRSPREEYHLTPHGGVLRSETMVLNGIPLVLTADGGIPNLDPVYTDVKSPIYIAPLAIAFVVIPDFDAPVCQSNAVS